MKNKYILSKVCLFSQTCSIEDAKRYFEVDGTFAFFDDYLNEDEIAYLNEKDEQFIYDLDSIVQSILHFRITY